MKIPTMIMALLFLLVPPDVSAESLFDKIKRKADEIIAEQEAKADQKVDKTIDDTVDSAEQTVYEGGESAPTQASSSEVVTASDNGNTVLVTMTQKELKRLGYSVSVDGQYGPGTRNAILSFEADSGRPLSGNVSPVLINALKSTPTPGGAVQSVTKNTQTGSIGETAKSSQSAGDAVSMNVASTAAASSKVSPNKGAATSSSKPATVHAVSKTTGLDQGVLPDPLFWGTPSGNKLRAIDQEIQGLRLGMPVMNVDQILTERGYQKNMGGQYSKQQTNEDGIIVRTQRIGILAVEPSQEFIDELEDGELKDMVLKAQLLINENQQAAQSSAGAARDARSSRDVRRSSSGSNIPRNLELVYLIYYQQIYNQDYQKFDLDAAIAQARSVFGPSTFPDDQLRAGMAYKTSPETTLIYHDASLLPAEYKTALVKSVPGVKLGHMEAVYNALRIPCGGPEHPWGPPGGGGCLPGSGDAYPDFEKQMELNRAIWGPYMRIKNIDGRAGLEIRLEWSYLQSERGMRERHQEQVARDKAPAANVEF